MFSASSDSSIPLIKVTLSDSATWEEQWEGTKDWKSDCKHKNCGFEGITATEDPQYLYMTNELDEDAGWARLFKYDIQKKEVTDTCEIKHVPAGDGGGQGVEALTYNSQDQLFYVGSRNNDNVYKVSADTGGHHIKDCEATGDKIKFDGDHQGLTALSFNQGGTVLYSFFNKFDDNDVPHIVATTIDGADDKDRTTADKCYRLDSSWTGVTNIEGLAFKGELGDDQIQVYVAHDEAPYSIELVTLPPVDCRNIA